MSHRAPTTRVSLLRRAVSLTRALPLALAVLAACSEGRITPPRELSADPGRPGLEAVIATPGTGPIAILSAPIPTKCLEVRGSQVALVACTGGAAQQFAWANRTGGPIQFGTQCLATETPRGGNGDLIVVATCNGAANQKWTATAASEIRGVGNGCIDIALTAAKTRDGVPAKYWTCRLGPQQKWTVQASQPSQSVATASLAPSTASLLPADTVRLTVTLKDSAGQTLSGPAVTWSSSNSGVAAISGGLVTAVAAGSATITATSQTKTATAVITVAPPAARAGFYVSPAGTAGGDGSLARPWDLATALAQPATVQPGDTIWLRGGTYTGVFQSRLQGQAGRPIVVRGYPGERAAIDGTLNMFGAYTWAWGFEVFYSDTRRYSGQSGSWPTDLPRAQMNLTVRGPGDKLINMVVHDEAEVGFWRDAPDGEIYGTLIYNTGWQGTDRGHGHGIYVQNDVGSKRIADNIVFGSFDWGLQAYGTTPVNNVTVEGNVIFNNGLLASNGGHDLVVYAGVPVQNFVLRDNFFYRTGASMTASLGSIWTASQSATVERNIFVGQVDIAQWQSLDFRNNTLVGGNDYQLVLTLTSSSQALSSYRLAGNRYYHNVGAISPFVLVGAGGMDLTAWQKLGFDSGSSLQEGRPSGVQVFVRPNQYEAGRANVVVYNWSGAGSAGVDLSGVLQPGQAFEVLDAQDYYGAPVLRGTYGGGTVQLPLVARSPANPIGGSPNMPPSTGIEFKAFVVKTIP